MLRTRVDLMYLAPSFKGGGEAQFIPPGIGVYENERRNNMVNEDAAIGVLVRKYTENQKTIASLISELDAIGKHLGFLIPIRRDAAI